MILRPLERKDIEQFYDNEKEIFGSYESWSFKICENEILNKDRYYVGIFKDDELIAWGGISLFMDSDLMTIAVKNNYRKMGYCSKILDNIIGKAMEKKLRNIFLEVRENNINAIRLYEKHGFHKISIRKNYYKNPLENAIIMKKSINDIGIIGSEILDKI